MAGAGEAVALVATEARDPRSPVHGRSRGTRAESTCTVSTIWHIVLLWLLLLRHRHRQAQIDGHTWRWSNPLTDHTRGMEAVCRYMRCTIPDRAYWQKQQRRAPPRVAYTVSIPQQAASYTATVAIIML